MGKRNYGGYIWTNHALQRLEQRGLTQEMAWTAFEHPDRSIPGKQSGTMEYQKKFDKSKVTIIAKQNEKQEWIILSCWIDPPLAGYLDDKKKKYYAKFKNASPLKQIWIELKEIFFGSGY